jgi:multicomponent Na+:H+ antiporter subunit C
VTATTAITGTAALVRTAGTPGALTVEAPAADVVLAPVGASVLMAVVVGLLFATGVYLLLQRSLTRVLIGLTLITHGANVLLLVAGGRAGTPPFVSTDGSVPEQVADPLPQAMALTAIVIAFAVSALLLALAYRSYVLTHDDAVQDDVEDRRIARVGGDE